MPGIENLVKRIVNDRMKGKLGLIGIEIKELTDGQKELKQKILVLKKKVQRLEQEAREEEQKDYAIN